MRRRGLLLLCLLTLTLAFDGLPGSPARLEGHRPSDLPARLTDKEFWALVSDFSEPNGSFQSDNLLSNEIVFARIVPALVEKARPDGVYLGVGPEQNFTYMAAIRPRIAFITDIRRGNLHTQLMYKALFELSRDRAEFVSRLFTKKRPPNLTAASTVTEIMNAYWDVPTESEATYKANLQAIVDLLTKTHALPLSAGDLDGIGRVYYTFYWYGPAMTYAASTTLNMSGVGRGTTYWDLMTQGDAPAGGPSYLGSEEKFQFLQAMERKNMVVPVVGNFSGPKALRSVGAYLRERGAVVTAFYLSNVEMYLKRDGSWPAFCANVATMPLDDNSVFIRPSGSPVAFRLAPVDLNNPQIRGLIVSNSGPSAGGTSGLVPIAEEVKNCSAPAR